MLTCVNLGSVLTTLRLWVHRTKMLTHVFTTGLRFDDVVRGGESTLLDLVALMDVFRHRHPEHFATLCRVPVRFEKVHFDRAVQCVGTVCCTL